MASASLSLCPPASAVAGRRVAGLPPLTLKRSAEARSSRRSFAVRALLSDDKPADPNKRKFITREEEPKQYWQTEAEKQGKGPMSTLLPYIAIIGLLTPFIILGLAFSQGWIDVPAR